MALLWAAGFIWMAVDVASASKKDETKGHANGAAALEEATGVPISADDVNAVAQNFNSF